MLCLNNDGHFVGSGGYGWTDELPQKDFDGRVRLSDMWGMSESQVTIGLSPEMFEEFVFQYQLPIIERFGLNCYGCCEPLDQRWKVIKNTKSSEVSVSPWANVEKWLKTFKTSIYFHGNPIRRFSKQNIDKDSIRKEIRKTLEVAKNYNCRIEIIMKDNHTLGNNPQNVIDWCRIAKEEAENM